MNMKKEDIATTPSLVPDLTDPEEARQAFIASEIFKRKY